MLIKHILPSVGFVPRNPQTSAFGGITATAWELASRQSVRDKVEIIGLARQEESFVSVYHDVKLTGITPWKWARWRRYNLTYIAPALFRAVSIRDSLLHCYTDPSLLYIPAPKKVFHIQNVPDPTDKGSYFNAVNQADAIVCCSHFVQQQLLTLFPQLAAKTYVVHNGGRQQKPSGRPLRKELGIPEETSVLLFVGAITEQKGLHVLLEAFGRIIKEYNDIALLVAGSSQLWYSAFGDPSMSDYERKLRDSSANLPVYFLGNVSQSQLGDVYHAADIFCCPSIWDEAFGIVNVEAMSAGLPVIASAVGGIPEIVNSDVGRLVPPNDVEALGEAIRELLEACELRTQLSKNALERAELFTWDRAFRSVDEIYSRIAGD